MIDVSLFHDIVKAHKKVVWGVTIPFLLPLGEISVHRLIYAWTLDRVVKNFHFFFSSSSDLVLTPWYPYFTGVRVVPSLFNFLVPLIWVSPILILVTKLVFYGKCTIDSQQSQAERSFLKLFVGIKKSYVRYTSSILFKKLNRKKSKWQMKRHQFFFQSFIIVDGLKRKYMEKYEFRPIPSILEIYKDENWPQNDF